MATQNPGEDPKNGDFEAPGEDITGIEEQTDPAQPFLKDIPLLMRSNKEAIVGLDANEETYENLPVSKFGQRML